MKDCFTSAWGWNVNRVAVQRLLLQVMGNHQLQTSACLMQVCAVQMQLKESTYRRCQSTKCVYCAGCDIHTDDVQKRYVHAMRLARHAPNANRGKRPSSTMCNSTRLTRCYSGQPQARTVCTYTPACTYLLSTFVGRDIAATMALRWHLSITSPSGSP